MAREARALCQVVTVAHASRSRVDQPEELHALARSGAADYRPTFWADGDHITDLQIPVSNRPVEVVLWIRVFQDKGTEAWGQPVYFEASAYAVPADRMMLL